MFIFEQLALSLNSIKDPRYYQEGIDIKEYLSSSNESMSIPKAITSLQKGDTVEDIHDADPVFFFKTGIRLREYDNEYNMIVKRRKIKEEVESNYKTIYLNKFKDNV